MKITAVKWFAVSITERSVFLVKIETDAAGQIVIKPKE